MSAERTPSYSPLAPRLGWFCYGSAFGAFVAYWVIPWLA